MNNKLLNKIAKKLVLSFTYRPFLKNYGFNTQSQKGIVIFNYYHYPVLWAYPKNDNEFQVYFTENEKVSYNKLERGDYDFCFRIDSISQLIDRYRYNSNFMRNYRIILFNDIVSRGAPDEKWNFLIRNKTTMSYQDFKNMMINDYDVRISSFENTFGNQNNENNINKEIKINNITFKSDGNLNQNFVNELYQKANEFIGNSNLKYTLYGIVEIKNNFNKNAVGDYSPNQDIIRTSGDKSSLEIFIHELGHRWYYKFASKQQIKAFKELYDNCNGKHIHLKEGDRVKYKSGKEYIFKGKEWGSLIMHDINDNEDYCFKLISTRSMTEINGQKVEKYNFPSNYSKTKFTEFIAECIEYAYCNISMDENLKQKVKEIVG